MTVYDVVCHLDLPCRSLFSPMAEMVFVDSSQLSHFLRIDFSNGKLKAMLFFPRGNSHPMTALKGFQGPCSLVQFRKMMKDSPNLQTSIVNSLDLKL